MRRIILAFLICLLPLQSFASMSMGVTMASMEAQMADAVQAPCHEASQPMQAAEQDCCGMQGICQIMCHLYVGLPFSNVATVANLSFDLSLPVSARFQSADLRAGFKPPLL